MRRLMILMLLLVFATPSYAADVREADVRAFLDDWLAAQNSGAYTKYTDKYAAKFFGVKRSGGHTYKYNRENWLKDRKRMFRGKMIVIADNVQITISEVSASIVFDQTWQNAHFKDKGAKQLFLVMENNRLKIAREEMLDSNVLMGKGMVLDSTNFPFAFAMKEGIVVPDNDVKIDFNKLRLHRSGVDYSVTAPVDSALLPASTRSLIGMPVKLYGPKGMCESKIKGFMLVSKKIPHFGEILRWKEEKTPRGIIAVNIYKEGLHHLVATTEKCSGDFAKDANLPESPVIMGKKADRKTTVMARKALKALPSYKSDLKPYIKDGYVESIRTFEVNYLGKNTTWVSICAVAGNPSCGQDGGALAVLWRMGKDSEGKPRLEFVQYLDEDIEYATDIDNDGSIEFLSRDPDTRGEPHSFGFVSTGGGKKREMKFRGSYDYDCPC